MTNKTKLYIELVPSTCFFSNVRSCVSRKRWNQIRSQVCSQAWDICRICQSSSEQSLDCHEVWDYDDAKQIQKLIGMVALCKNCHRVKHFGLAQIRGKAEKAFQHLMQVNRWSQKQADKHIKQSFEQWADRSQKKWKLDISYLCEYGIEVDKIKEPNAR